MFRDLRVVRWLSAGAAMLLCASAPSLLDAQAVQGRVLVAATDEPVDFATVHLLEGDEGERTVVSGLAGAQGEFILRAPRTGTYRLQAHRIGYENVVSPPFDLLQEEDPLEVELLLAVEAVPLAPLVIISDRPARLNLRLHTRGFYDRQNTFGRSGLGLGHFLDREDIDQRSPFNITDLLRELPGVRVEGVGGIRQRITLRSVVRITEGRCVPIIFIDGVPAARGDAPDEVPDIDAIVSPFDLVGVEVYPGINQPAEFIRDNICGSIVLWTGSRAGGTIGESRAAQPHQASFVLELEGGFGIGDFAPAGTGIHWGPRPGGRVTLAWRILPRLAVYGGAGLSAFECNTGFCRGHEVTFASTGLEFGIRADAEIRGRPWLQVGAVRHRLRTDWTMMGESGRDTSDASLGFRMAVGTEIPLWPRISLTPGIGFTRYIARGSAGIRAPDPSVRDEVRLLEFGTGIRVEL